ncbi:MAG: LytR cell envelope-related transcriptional attenuator, partial [Solirubrobacteraceae bacterium]|nr:LytR cell envelope-related transcriptional attenuator [Solirubrobacteraceae bacterium]
APTPPASWSGQGSRAQLAWGDHVSTVSAGQITTGAKPVAKATRPGSRKAVWIGAVAALVVAVVLVLLLTGGNDTPPADNAIGGSPPPAASPPAASKPKVDRKATQVAVLNGTTQNGLAGSVANKIEDKGFTILSKGNNADQKVATTSVSFRVGSEDAAKIVAKVVDVPAGAVQPMDANLAAAVAAEANVVVVVGNNLGSTG